MPWLQIVGRSAPNMSEEDISLICKSDDFGITTELDPIRQNISVEINSDIRKAVATQIQRWRELLFSYYWVAQ